MSIDWKVANWCNIGLQDAEVRQEVLQVGDGRCVDLWINTIQNQIDAQIASGRMLHQACKHRRAVGQIVGICSADNVHL
jgi:hypothetical protein